mgnify:CR=1 FL=1
MRRLISPVFADGVAEDMHQPVGPTEDRDRMDEIEDALRRCDLFVSIGTSGAVYPAAGYVQTARYYGARTLELNLEPSQGSVFFHESRMGKASNLVPRWVEEMLA